MNYNLLEFIMNKLSAIWGLFKQGQSVSDPTRWKNRQITATVLAAFVLALVNVSAAFGYSIPIDADTANAIAAGIIAVVNVILTITTTEKIGVPNKPSESSSVASSKQEVSKDTENENKANQEPQNGIPEGSSTGYLSDIYK